MEGSLVAYKVFTNGSVLQASEINDNLMRQSVMVFTNAAARSAAITLPLEGMLTWLEDVNRYENYNGSAWVPAFESALVGTSTFTSVGSVALDNIFTSNFRYYDYYFTATGATAGAWEARLRTGASDLATTTYITQSFVASATTLVGARTAAATAWAGGTIRTSSGTWVGTIANPFIAAKTQLISQGLDGTVPLRIENATGENSETNSYNGIRFFSSASFSGNLSIYGRKA
jgi:hypothetical protein